MLLYQKDMWWQSTGGLVAETSRNACNQRGPHHDEKAGKSNPEGQSTNPLGQTHRCSLTLGQKDAAIGGAV
jgi:hypothetical protein